MTFNVSLMLFRGSFVYLDVAPAAAAATDVQKPAHRTERDGNINSLHLSKKTNCFVLNHEVMTLNMILELEK